MLMGLTLLAGVVDATSILALDHVFVATITGNIVFLGLGLIGAAGFSVISSVVAVAAFVLGVFPGDRLCRLSTGHRGRAVRNVAAMKAVLAVPSTIIVLVAPEPLPTAARLAVTALLAASFGGQLALIRYLKVPDLLTAVMTMTTIGVLDKRGSRHDLAASPAAGDRLIPPRRGDRRRPGRVRRTGCVTGLRPADHRGRRGRQSCRVPRRDDLAVAALSRPQVCVPELRPGMSAQGIQPSSENAATNPSVRAGPGPVTRGRLMRRGTRSGWRRPCCPS
jgi:hypothetical protein